MKITCEWCGTEIKNPPQSSYASSRPKPIYCSEDCEVAKKYHDWRERFDSNLYWTHDCGYCERPMFTPREMDGWYCPECGVEEPIDKTGLRYIKSKLTWGGRLNHEFEHGCPECDSSLWTFDGAMQCHNCDVYFNTYGRVFWALIEQEYPPKYTSWNDREDSEQSTLEQ